MPAALLRYLVFNMDGGRPGAFQFLNAAVDGESAAKAGVDIHQQGQLGRPGNTPGVFHYIVQGGNPQIRQAMGGIGHSGSGEIQGRMAGVLRQQGAVGIDGADNGQGSVFGQRLAESVAGTHGETSRTVAFSTR